MAAGDGLVTMTPTSIAHSGTSATINSDGGVDFTAVTSLSLNGVFTSDYDNYVLVFNTLGVGSTDVVGLRLRTSGTDATTGYTSQEISVSSTSISSGRNSLGYARITDTSIGSGLWSGDVVHIYGPNLAQATAFRSVGVSSLSSAYIADVASTHSTATAYDSITILCQSTESITGNVHVFGYEE